MDRQLRELVQTAYENIHRMKPHERAVVEDAQQAIEDHSPVDVSEVEQLEDLVQRYA